MRALVLAVLLAAAPAETRAASLLGDGNFDKLPAGTAPRVILGQRTVAGETILGQIGDRRVVAGIQQ